MNGTNYEVLIMEPSPFPILIPLGPKYSPQDPIFKYPYPMFLPYCKRPRFTVIQLNWQISTL